MPDVLITDNLEDIISSIELIEKRSRGITGADDFVLSEAPAHTYSEATSSKSL
ncbi:MAG: hypothetical protein ABIJ52_14635 [Pseudomonadota bacterium]